MKKYLALAVLLLAAPAIARITGTPPAASSPDAFCVGASGAEVCVDASGNLIPTTDDDTDLGTTTLEWKNAYFDGTVTTDALTVDATLSLPSGSVTTAMLGSQAVTTPKIGLTDQTSQRLLCVTTAKTIGTCQANFDSTAGVSCNCS